MDGYVYIFSNEAMPGLLKVGCTSHNPKKRASELYTTGVPTPFKVEYCIIINDYQLIERKTHLALKTHKFGKEFFKCDLVTCIRALKNVARENLPYKEWYRDNFLKARIEEREEEYQEEVRKRAEAERRKKEAEERSIREQNRLIHEEAQRRRHHAELQRMKDNEIRLAEIRRRENRATVITAVVMIIFFLVNGFKPELIILYLIFSFFVWFCVSTFGR